MSEGLVRNWEKPQNSGKTVGKSFISNHNPRISAKSGLLKLAREGDPEAQYQLAEALRLGETIRQDPERALHWYRASAEQGYPPAQNDLGSMLVNGMGCEANPEESVTWFHKAAKQGLATGQWNLAQRYLHGSGVVRDDNQAVLWLVMAFKQSHIEATSQLGTMFRFGRGVPQDILMAAQLHIIGAKNGDPVAHGNLSDYRSDLQDLALDGSTEASLAVAQIYGAGLGTDADLAEALAWLQWGNSSPLAQSKPDQRDKRRGTHGALGAGLDTTVMADVARRFNTLQSRAWERRNAVMIERRGDVENAQEMATTCTALGGSRRKATVKGGTTDNDVTLNVTLRADNADLGKSDTPWTLQS